MDTKAGQSLITTFIVYRSSLFLDTINVVRIIATGARVVAVNIIELNVIVKVSSNKVNGITNLDGVRELSVGLEISRLVRRIFQDDISFCVLEQCR